MEASAPYRPEDTLPELASHGGIVGPCWSEVYRKRRKKTDWISLMTFQK